MRTTSSSKLESENVDQVLASFYDTVIRKSIKKTRIEEGKLRHWCEKMLITTGETCAVVHKGNGNVDGIPNKVAECSRGRTFDQKRGTFW